MASAFGRPWIVTQTLAEGKGRSARRGLKEAGEQSDEVTKHEVRIAYQQKWHTRLSLWVRAHNGPKPWVSDAVHIRKASANG